jgi:4-hydroxy-2-oxoheptanedioate aldolase
MISEFINSLKKQPQLGVAIMYPAAGIIERIGPDWDWIWVDGQHGQLSYPDILSMVRAANLIRKPVVVRVPSHDSGVIGQYLDCAADAVMVPMINNVEEAQKAVINAKFPPFGCRSYGGRRPIDIHGRQYANASSPQPLLICQIETKQALENCDQIAAVEGVDAVFLGPDDMAMQYGLAMEKPKPEDFLNEAIAIVGRSAAKYNKIAGIVAADPKSFSKVVKAGYHLVVGTADASLLAVGSKNQAETLRNVKLEKNTSDGIY